MQPYRSGYGFEDMIGDSAAGLLAVILVITLAVLLTLVIIVLTELTKAFEDGWDAGGEVRDRLQGVLVILAIAGLMALGLVMAGSGFGLVFLCWVFAGFVIAVELLAPSRAVAPEELELAQVLEPWDEPDMLPDFHSLRTTEPSETFAKAAGF